MGHIYVSLTISNMAGSRSKDVQALADTGATLTVIPERIARELELAEVSTESVETGAGELELVRSAARITIDRKQSVQDVLISDFIDRVLLGVVTLEAMALSLDPLTGKLKERRLLLYIGAKGSRLKTEG
ncbi:retroviral-like aspartic protease family protein [Dehalococcoidia bacterium]|nr:retroviral-like aspartic protease family protein [Dehalococcoidia bacterium]